MTTLSQPLWKRRISDRLTGTVPFPPENMKPEREDRGGRRHNWWCVLYPSLCFIDESHGVVSEEKKEDLKEVLTEEEFLTILNDPKEKG